MCMNECTWHLEVWRKEGENLRKIRKSQEPIGPPHTPANASLIRYHLLRRGGREVRQSEDALRRGGRFEGAFVRGYGERLDDLLTPGKEGR